MTRSVTFATLNLNLPEGMTNVVFVMESKEWHEAQEYCNQHHGSLVDLQTLQAHEGSIPACAKTDEYWVADVQVKSELVDIKGK